MSLFSKIFSRRYFAATACAVLLPVAAALTACSEAPQLPKSADKTATTEQPADPSASPDDVGGADNDGVVGEEAPPAAKPEPSKKRAYRREAPPAAAGESEGYAESAPPPESKAADEPVIAEAPPPPPVALDVPEPSAPGAGTSGGFGTTGVGPGGGGTGYGTGIGRGFGTIGKGSGSSSSATSKAAKAEPAKDEEPKAYDLVPVYYGTDRAVEPNAKRLQYGTVRDHKLHLGRAMVTVPTSHKVPNIERPWVIEIPYFKYKVYEEKEDPAKHFTMQEVKALSKDELLAYVKERLAASKTFKDHAFIFVHGFNTSFDAAVYRTAQIANDLKFDGAPFVYSWPSGGNVASYTYDRGSAEAAEPHLAEFLDMVVKQTGAKSISLIAHSMGNELLLRVLERMRPSVPEGVVISQVILAAPDVDRDKFANIARQITDFAKGVTLYAAANDRALAYSARFWGGVPRAGDVPATGPLIVDGVDTIDVTAISTETLSLNHSSYAEKKALLDDIKLLIQTGQRPPDKREPNLKKITTAAGTFWRYPPSLPPTEQPAEQPTGSVP